MGKLSEAVANLKNIRDQLVTNGVLDEYTIGKFDESLDVIGQVPEPKPEPQQPPQQ